MREDLVCGMDIGTTKVCTIIAQLDAEGHPNIIGVGSSPSRGLRKGVVVDIDDTVVSIFESVQKAERMAGEKVDAVFAGITGHHITSLNTSAVISITSEDHVITPEHVLRVMGEAESAAHIPEGHAILHSIPRQFIIDGQDGVHRPEGMAGSHLRVEAHIITAADSFRRNLEECIRRAHLEIEDLILEPLAASEAVLTEAEKSLGVVLADIGGGTTDIAIWVDGAIAFSSALPIGGNHVTRDISIGLRTSFDKAEQLKHQHGCALVEMVKEGEVIEVQAVGTDSVHRLPRHVLAQIIEPRVRELLRMVHRAVRASGFGDGLAAGVVLTGGGSLLPGTQDLAQEILELPVRIGMPTVSGAVTESLRNPMYSTAVGLVQRAAKSRPRRRKVSLSAEGIIRNWTNWLERIKIRFRSRFYP